jgi:hypothetical protein
VNGDADEQDKTSMMKLLRQVDKATGYIYVPSSSSTTNQTPMVSSLPPKEMGI